MYSRVRWRALLLAALVTAFMAPVAILAAPTPHGAVSGFHYVKLANGASVGLSKGQRPSMHMLDVSRLSRHAMTGGARFGSVPFRTRFTAAQFAAMKAAAVHNLSAPRLLNSISSVQPLWSTAPPAPEQLVTGLTDNFIVCAFFGTGCEPPDMAIAASPDWSVQATNTSVAVFDKHGVMVLGYPVDFPTFFGVPASCHGIPFTTDPRAFYDPNDQRFFVAMQAPNGVADTCTPSSTSYIAVSQTSNPSFGWNVYAINSAIAGPTYFADYTQLGFDSQAVYIGGNQFNCCGPGYGGAFTIILDKHAMEAGAAISSPNVIGPYLAASSPTCPGGGCLLDTVNPTTSVANLSQQPQATILVDADQSNPTFPCGFGGITCNNLDVWAIAKPLAASPIVSEQTIALLNNFVLPPPGDEPGCPLCIETIDNRVSGTPTFSPWDGGTVSFGLETAVNFGLITYPGYQWGQIAIKEAGNKLTSATLAQGGIVAASNSTHSFPATQLLPNGDMYLVSDIMSAAEYPGWEYRVRHAGDAANTLSAPRLVQRGLDTYLLPFGVPGTGNLRWGDFEATSYAGFATNGVWLASQYGNTDYDWGTSFAKVH